MQAVVILFAQCAPSYKLNFDYKLMSPEVVHMQQQLSQQAKQPSHKLVQAVKLSTASSVGHPGAVLAIAQRDQHL